MTPTEIGMFVGQGVVLITAVLSMTGRRVRTPADDQARIDAGIKILENQLARTEQEQSRWLQVEQYLREQLQKADEKDARQDAEIERLRSLLDAANAQIRDLTLERNELTGRITRLAEKYARHEEITLADILGQDIEDTFPSVAAALKETS